MAVEAVIWDFGGVFTSSPFEAFNRLEAELGAPKDHIRRVNATNHHDNAWALFERNEVDAARFDELFLEESTALGFPIRGADVLPKLSGELRPRMVAALKARGIEVPYMVKANEGHGFSNEENRFDFYRAMEEFLGKHLGGRVEKASE